MLGLLRLAEAIEKLSAALEALKPSKGQGEPPDASEAGILYTDDLDMLQREALIQMYERETGQTVPFDELPRRWQQRLNQSFSDEEGL